MEVTTLKVSKDQTIKTSATTHVCACVTLANNTTFINLHLTPFFVLFRTLEGIKSQYPTTSSINFEREDSDILDSLDLDSDGSNFTTPDKNSTKNNNNPTVSPYKSSPLRANHSINPEVPAKRITNPSGIQPKPPNAGLSRQRMRNFQRRQDILQASRNNSNKVQVAPVITSPSTSPQQLLK